MPSRRHARRLSSPTLIPLWVKVYLAHNALVAFYGGAGALVLVLLWAYYASQVFLFGAAVIAVYADQRGSPVRPTDEAVAVHSASEGDAVPEG